MAAAEAGAVKKMKEQERGNRREKKEEKKKKIIIIIIINIENLENGKILEKSRKVLEINLGLGDHARGSKMEI